MKKLSRITNGFCEKKMLSKGEILCFRNYNIGMILPVGGCIYYIYRTVSKVVVPAATIYFIIKFII